QPGPQPLGRLPEPGAVWTSIEPERRRGDHVDRDLGEIETTMPGHARDAFAHDQKRVFGQVDQDRTRLRHGVLAQTRRASGHAQGHVQPEPCLGAFVGATDHTYRPCAPEPFHEPALGVVLAGDLPHAHHGKQFICTHWYLHTFTRTHGHLHTFTFFLGAERGCLG